MLKDRIKHKVALIQHSPVFLNLKETLLKVSDLVKNAAQKGADLDLDMVIEPSLPIDTNGHYSRPDIFSLQVNDISMRT